LKKFFPKLENCTIAIIGLGYVGLPLAMEIARTKKCLRTSKKLNRNVIGFDINSARIEELNIGFDRNMEIDNKVFKQTESILFTSDSNELTKADLFIITVPTPIDKSKRPQLKFIEEASSLVGNTLKKRELIFNKNNIPLIVYESTVYPTTTEEICIPILEKESGFKLNSKSNGFCCGYSPERINPGDSEHTLSSIMKVTSGSNKDSLEWIDSFYGSFIKAGTFKAKSIKVAEAAKVIENTQRDLNIGLINELKIIFNKMNIDTLEVLEAARTKWNFLDFRPGLVGGHCIGVDPYYLTYKAQKLGYYPQLILAARKINDEMGNWLAKQIIIRISEMDLPLSKANVLIMGFTFKENCPDIRNTKVINIIETLNSFKIKTTVIDPFADSNEAYEKYKIRILKEIPPLKKFDVVCPAVAHKDFKELRDNDWLKLLTEKGSFIDLKGIVPKRINPINF